MDTQPKKRKQESLVNTSASWLEMCTLEGNASETHKLILLKLIVPMHTISVTLRNSNVRYSAVSQGHN